jgi:hypothetical protein
MGSQIKRKTCPILSPFYHEEQRYWSRLAVCYQLSKHGDHRVEA